MRWLLAFYAVVFIVSVETVYGQSSETTSTVKTTTPTLENACAALNTSKGCEDCVSNPKCLFCSKPRKCVPYPVGQLIPHSDICDLGKARWGVCFMNYKALLISMGVIAGVIVVSITCCCVYCCCCRGNSRAKRKYIADEQKWADEQEQRKTRNEERRAERKTKLDDIRRKYGLMKDDQPYQRFDDA